MNLKNRLRLLANNKFNANTYARRAYVRKKYTVEDRITEVTYDPDVIVEVNPVVNEILIAIEATNYKLLAQLIDRNGDAEDGTKQKTLGEVLAVYTDLTLHTLKNINDEPIGIVGWFIESGILRSNTFTVQGLKLLADAIGGVKLLIDRKKDVLSASDFNIIYNAYVDLTNGYNAAIDVFDFETSIPFYIDTAILSRDRTREVLRRNKIDVDIYLEEVNLIKTYIDRRGTEASQRVTANTTDIFRENNLTIEFTNEGFDYFTSNIFNLAFNTKTNPSPDGRALVKIPQPNTFIFATPIKDTEYFVSQAVKYDSVEVNIDNDLQMIIGKFLVSIKADEVNLTTGKLENQGIIMDRTSLSTGLMEDIRLESSINNNYIHLLNKSDIEINGKGGKVVIGLTGEGSSINTPYDADIKLMTSELEKIRNSYNRFALVIKDTGIKYTQFKDSSITFNNLGLILESIASTLDDYNLPSITSYTDFTKLKVDTFNKALAIKKIIVDESWDKRLAGSNWDKPSLEAFNSEFKTLSNLTDINISNTITMATVGSTMPMRADRKSVYSDFNSATRNNLYGGYFDYLKDSGYNDLYLTLTKLVDSNYFYNLYQKDRDKAITYCSPEEGATIVAIYLTNEYIILNSSLNNLLKLQEQYRLNNKSNYAESLGSILRDMTSILKGSILSYTSTTPGQPPYILQTTGAEDIFDQDSLDINQRIDKLL